MCQRCVRAGWSCSWDPETEAIPSAVPSRIFHTQRETRFFDFFRHNTIADLSGWASSYFWQRLVLQMAHSELAPRRAVIALGALHSDGVNSPHVLRYYGEALTTLRQLLTQSDSPTGMVSIDVCLATCLLLSIFEVARRDYDAAQIHYTQGVQLLKQHSQTQTQTQTQHRYQLAFYERTLLAQFSHLETLIISFLSSRPGYHQDAIFVEYNITQLAIPSCFPSIPEAHESFIRLLHSIQNRATRAANTLAFASPDSVPDDDGIFPHRETYSASMRQAAALRAVNQESLLGLTRWSAAFYACIASTQNPSLADRRVIALLKGISTMLYIRCSRDPALGQMAADAFLPEYEFAMTQFETAVDLAWEERTSSPSSSAASSSSSSPSPTSDSSTTKQSRPSKSKPAVTPLFSLCTGILNHVYALHEACRDARIRRRGLAVLERMPYQEGLWTGEKASRVVGAIGQFEERNRVPGVEGVEGIKKEDRVVGVNFHYYPDRFKIIADWERGRREVGWVMVEL